MDADFCRQFENGQSCLFILLLNWLIAMLFGYFLLKYNNLFPLYFIFDD